MALWNKLFGKQAENSAPTNEEPDNTRLMELLNRYASTRNYKDYKRAYEELETGRAKLLLPSHNDAPAQTGWRKTEEGETLKLTSIFEIEGLKVLGAFTDEEALLSWAKKPTPYVAMPSKAVLEMCHTHGMGRIVINTGLDTMFVLERDATAFHSTTVEAGKPFREGVPARPLRREIREAIARGFQGIRIVDQAFHYGKDLDGDYSLVIGVKLSQDNENARKAVMLAVHDVLKTETSDQPVDVYFIETKEAYKRISSIQGAIFFQSPNPSSHGHDSISRNT